MSPRRVLFAAIVLFAAVSAVSATSLDVPTAQTYVYQSAAAYCSFESVYGFNCSSCVNAIPEFKTTHMVYIESQNVFGFVGYSTAWQAIIVTFRGTVGSSLTDWIENLEAWKTRTDYPHCENGCTVHAGFYAAHLALKPGIVSGVLALKEQFPNWPVHMTGHSLGAALTLLSVADFAMEQNIQIDVAYTFGEPRVGDPNFASWAESSVLSSMEYKRVTHYRDIVPHVPPEALGFHHVPLEYYGAQPTGTVYNSCDGTGEDDSCSDQWNVWDWSIDDHLVYVDIPVGSGHC